MVARASGGRYPFLCLAWFSPIKHRLVMPDLSGTLFEINGDAIAEAIVDQCFTTFPELPEMIGSAGRSKCLTDVRYHLLYLHSAVAVDRPSLFRDYIAWVKVVFARLGLNPAIITTSLTSLKSVLERTPSPHHLNAAAFVADALSWFHHMPDDVSFDLNPQQPHFDLAHRYLHLLMASQRREALALILHSVADGVSVKDLYMHVFQPALRDVGRLWQSNRITVAQEHYFTAATQMIMSQLYPYIFGAGRRGPILVGTCVSGELHEIGMRMLTDIFEMEGYDTHYLGANVPTSSIVDTVLERQADLLAISATITTHLPLVQEIIDRVRAKPQAARVKIMVGGYPFNVAPKLWQAMGADGTAVNPIEGVAVANRLVGREGGLAC